MRYPDARRDDVVETLHGHRVADPYRWLEDASSPEVEAWSQAQDAMVHTWMDGLAAREPLRATLRGMVPDVTGAPTVAGGRWFWSHRAAGEDHAVLRVAPDAAGYSRGEGRVLVDPNALSPDGTTTLDGWAPSHDGDRLAYLLSEGGDEESRLWIVDTGTGERIDGPIDRMRYSPLAWLPGGEALAYVRRLAPGQVPPGEEAFHRRVWLHRIGTDADRDDVLLFGEGTDPTAYLGVTISEDGQWMSVTSNLGTAPRNDLYISALPGELPAPGAPAELRWRPVAVGLDAQTWPHLDRRGRLWLLTDLGAPRRRLCVCSPDSPEPAAWRNVLAEDAGGAVLEDFVLAGDRLVALWSRHALSEITVHDRATGDRRASVALPGAGTADLTGRPDEGSEVWVGYTDYATPYEVQRLDVEDASLTDRLGARSGRPGPAVHSSQITARSADGTEVRLTVVAPAVAPERPLPTILYGYGGFNVSMTPAYSSSILAWVAAGGVWAVANLRGGSEEGEQWHRAGMRAEKQRVFEDFEAAADVLVAGGWTTPAQLGIMGGSNGGLLVGAALTRSPQRYAAVVCSAPLLDMVRYERFGLGVTWNDEYGSAEDPTELGWLLGYSPYHHVVDGIEYPAVLFTVFDGDTRVDPLHARKMAAALQHATAADAATRPILLRREADVGHGARSVSRTVGLAADQLAFLGGELGATLP